MVGREPNQDCFAYIRRPNSHVCDCAAFSEIICKKQNCKCYKTKDQVDEVTRILVKKEAQRLY